MRLKNSYFFTLREDAKDEDSISSNLLVRGGFIKKSSAGIYMMLPMGWRIMQKIMNIIRDEMDKTGCQELLMPALIPEDIYIASGRRAGFGHDMFSLKDRKGQNYVLGPTHEELFAIAAKMQIRSYKDMPFSLSCRMTCRLSLGSRDLVIRPLASILPSSSDSDPCWICMCC